MNQTVMDWPEGLDTHSFSGVGRLATASPQGAQAADILDRFQILECLVDYGPEVVGTLPLGIDIATSDIDILCNVSGLDAFGLFADHAFGDFAGYTRHRRDATDHVEAAAVVRFECDGLPIEIFATDRPAREQYGFVHMLIEARILHVMGDGFARKIQDLKQAGIKTEPAFASLLQLDGDPYLALAKLADLSPSELCGRLGVSGI